MSIDVLIRGATAYSMDQDGAVHRAVAIDDGRISAVSADPTGLDQFVDAQTRVLDAPELTLFRRFSTTTTTWLKRA